jgi:hypothetical protein
MKVLMVAGFFPPHAPQAATRAPSFARWLLQSGHDVRVIAAANADWAPIATHGLPEGIVTFSPIDQGRLSLRQPWRDAGRLWTEAVADGMAGRLAALAAAALPYPDKRVGWLRHALAAADRVIAEWQPDVVFATAPPVTTLLAGCLIARRHRLPWVAEYRDLWVDHPYYTASPLRRLLDRMVESWMLRSVSGIVTVTEGWRTLLAKKLPVPVCLALNGFDADELPPETEGPSPGLPLTLLYAGSLYGNKRDPSPLLQALAAMGATADQVRMIFHVDEAQRIHRLEAALKIGNAVEINGLIARERVLALQQGADVLVLLRWEDPSEDSVIPGKLFEYIGAGRPILAVGRPTGEVAEIIRRDGLGLVSTDPGAIAAWLRAAIEAKRTIGSLPGIPPAVRATHARAAQFRRIEALLEQVVIARPAPEGHAI